MTACNLNGVSVAVTGARLDVAVAAQGLAAAGAVVHGLVIDADAAPLPDVASVSAIDVNDIDSVIAAAVATGADILLPTGARLAGEPRLRTAAIPVAGPTAEQLEATATRHRLRLPAVEVGWPVVGLSGTTVETVAITVVGDGRSAVVIGDRVVAIRRGDDVVISESPAPAISDSLRGELHSLAAELVRYLELRAVVDVVLRHDTEVGMVALEQIAYSHPWDRSVLPGQATATLAVAMALGRCELPAAITDAGHAIAWRLATSYTGERLTGVAVPNEATAVVCLGDQPTGDQRLAWQVVRGDSRESAREAALAALIESTVDGPTDAAPNHILATLQDPAVIAGKHPPALVVAPPRDAIEVIQPGLQTTIQDVDGRLGLWEVGVPPSGAFDSLSLRHANQVVGNPYNAAGLEITLGGPTLRFTGETMIALTGAVFAADIDGEPVPWYEPITVPAGAVLRIGGPTGAGMRCALAVRGGFDCLPYLGSRATFTLGGFGGHAGRELTRGDELGFGVEPLSEPAPLPKNQRPKIARRWSIGVTLGPHTDPEFLTPEGMQDFLAAHWKVSPQSNRTGIRLDGPNPQWARTDGGEAGLHPSNIHDNAYALGSVDLTGDTPVILGPDGPSLGGFVCPLVVVTGERWKLGQLRPGDTLVFRVVDNAGAKRLRADHQAPLPKVPAHEPAVLATTAAQGDRPSTCIRRAGDANLLVEYGELELDIALRMRVQLLHDHLEGQHIDGIIDLTPGIRSCQVHYDPDRIDESAVIELIQAVDAGLPSADNAVVPSRTVHLPLCWDDPSTRKAIEIYTRTVNPYAPWCPWNIEFIRRINGLDSVDDVYRTVFDAEYLVLGLGDVYLGAPVATPLDPRHRLVTTKYNPARTWTPENAVGIGGAYLCIYGMEGPGGYQFVGRTIQIWNSWKSTDAFEPGTPWLLRQFDRIKWFPVSHDELTDARQAFPHGEYPIRIDEGEFRLADYTQFLADNADSIAAFRDVQRAAFNAERERWAEQPTAAASP